MERNRLSYVTPELITVDIRVEAGIAQSTPSPSAPEPGMTGNVDYKQSDDHFSF